MRFLLLGDQDQYKRLFVEDENWVSLRYDKQTDLWVNGGFELMDNRFGFDSSEPEGSPWRFGNSDCMERIIEITKEEAERFIGKSINLAEISELLGAKTKQPEVKESRFHIVVGDVFDYLEGKDLIVNSANKYMKYGSGICGQIYKRAGAKQLEELCEEMFPTNMKVNEVRITPGLNLGIDILHILSPKHHESMEPLEELVESYLNVCGAASENHYQHVISISLGTGVHGYTHDEVGPLIGPLLDEYVNSLKIDFTLVLPTEEIKQKYIPKYSVSPEGSFVFNENGSDAAKCQNHHKDDNNSLLSSPAYKGPVIECRPSNYVLSPADMQEIKEIDEEEFGNRRKGVDRRVYLLRRDAYEWANQMITEGQLICVSNPCGQRQSVVSSGLATLFPSIEGHNGIQKTGYYCVYEIEIREKKITVRFVAAITDEIPKSTLEKIKDVILPAMETGFRPDGKFYTKNLNSMAIDNSTSKETIESFLNGTMESIKQFESRLFSVERMTWHAGDTTLFCNGKKGRFINGKFVETTD